MRTPIEIRIHDSHLGIWQDNAQDASFRREIYAVLIRDMRARGWSVRRDPKIHQHYRILSPSHRLAARGTLRCAIEISGRVVEVKFWSTTAPQVNRHGRQHDFDKMQRMRHIDRLRVELEFKRITAWLETIAPVKLSRTLPRDTPAMAKIEHDYAESWHRDKDLGRPTWHSDRDRTAKDGALLDHGQTVWLMDYKGRMIRGVAYYNINNMWWVIAGGQLFNKASFDVYSTMPQQLRMKRNDRARRQRLEHELSTAVARMDFQRAHRLKMILFGNEQTFMIWARKNKAYYRSNYAGYTTDRVHAGKYLRGEAEAECRRVPHELEMVCPDGSHVSFDRRAA